MVLGTVNCIQLYLQQVKRPKHFGTKTKSLNIVTCDLNLLKCQMLNLKEGVELTIPTFEPHHEKTC